MVGSQEKQETRPKGASGLDEGAWEKERLRGYHLGLGTTRDGSASCWVGITGRRNHMKGKMRVGSRPLEKIPECSPRQRMELGMRVSTPGPSGRPGSRKSQSRNGEERGLGGSLSKRTREVGGN